MASVFVSHSSLDGAVVDAIASFLRDEEHHAVFLDRHPDDGIHVGERWEEVLYDRLHAADVVVCVVTANHVRSAWCFAEVALAKALGRQVFPVGAEAGVRHPLLESVQAVDYVTDPDAAKAALRDRLRVIEAGGGAAWDESRPAFPGLAAFDTADAAVFFGRETETERLAAEIRSLTTRRASKAMVVVGASGSGKSSLVRAGLVPKLVSEGWWAIPPVLPGPDPFGALVLAVAQAWKVLEPGRRIDRRELSEQVRADFAGVVADLLFAAPSPGGPGLLLVVDQLEEVFTRAARDAAAEFLALLDGAAGAGRSTAVVATLRSEFVSELLASEPAGHLRENQFPLAPMSRASLRRVVTGPARKARLELTEDLVQRLVEDTGSGEALPLLAYVLRLLTERAQPGDRLDVEAYAKIGGVQGALRAQADDALRRAVTAANRTPEAILEAFVELVSVDRSGRPSRRRVARAGVATDMLRAFDVFVDARLVSSDEVAGVPSIGVTHEALFTAWPQLSDALVAHRQRLQLRRRLEESAADWEREGREPSMLWRGEQLRAASEAVDAASDVQRSFVAAAQAADADRRGREADILADRIRASGLVERDSELALLLLLAAGDEYARTDEVVGGLRHALARHRLIGRAALAGGFVTALAISDDGAIIAAADLGTNVYVPPSTRPRPLPPPAQCRVHCWDAGTRELVRTLWFDGRQIDALRLQAGPAGLQLTARVDQHDVAADVATGQTVAASSDAIGDDSYWPEAFAGWSQPPTSAGYAWSVPARRVVTGEFGGIAWHSVDPIDAPAVVGHVDGPVVALRWRADGTRLAVTEDGRVIDLAGGVEHGPLGPVRAVSRDAAHVLVDPPLRIHDTAAGVVRELEARGSVRAAGFSQDGRLLAVATWGALSVFAVGTGERIARFGEHSDEEGDVYTGIGFSRDGTRLVTASLGRGRAHVWEIATGTAIRPVPSVLDHTPDGADVVAREFREIAADLSAGVELRLEAYPDDVLVSVAPDRSAMLAIRGLDGAGLAEEYRLPAGNPLFVDAQPCVSATFSPDSRHVLCARADGTIDVSPSRETEDVFARARRHVFRELTREDRASFGM